MSSDGQPKDARGLDIFGDFSQKRLAVASALATPARSESAVAPATSSLRPPAHQAFSVLPLLDLQAPSDDDDDLFSSPSETE